MKARAKHMTGSKESMTKLWVYFSSRLALS